MRPQASLLALGMCVLGSSDVQAQPHASADRTRAQPVATSAPSEQLAAGTIRVRVVDAGGAPVAGQSVRVGIMEQGGSRDAHRAETNAEGIVLFEDLPGGTGQAYRVTVRHQGATYGSTPFRLEPNRGQQVEIRRLGVSRDDRFLLQVMGQTLLQFRGDGRVHVSQQARLANLGEETYLFPEEGLSFPLPPGFTAFQTQPVMTDQRVVPSDEGLSVRGSLPPGQTTLVWTYDLPLEGDDLVLSQPMPINTYRYRVIVEASEDMGVDVEGFGEPETHETQGQRVLLAQLERRPRDAALDRLRIRVTGIPTPGPLRYLALGAAIVLLFMGLLLVSRGGQRAGELAKAREERRGALLDDAAELERLYAVSEIGPRYRERRLAEIVEELASLLRLDAASREAEGQSAKRG